MKNTKFVKARCRKCNVGFAVEVINRGGRYEAVDFVKLTPEQDRVFESQIEVPSLTTASSLQSCSKCGKNVLGGCSCAKSSGYSCDQQSPYNYQCIFCNEMHLDYSYSADIRDGETVTLAQGQVITLKRRGVSISEIMVGMGWSPSRQGSNLDMDSSVVMVEKNGQIHELVYFGNKDDAASSIHHYGDNLYGSEKSGNDKGKDDENILVKLNRVPANVSCLIFIVNIYEARSRNQRLSDVRDVHINLTETSSRQVMASYSTFGQNPRDNSLIIGAAYRTGTGWSFKAMGDCFDIGNVNELAALARDKCLSLIQHQ